MTAGAWAGNNAPFFNGSMDELRFSNSARSPAWLATEFSNQNSPGSFVSLGAPQ
jgi:vancomycin resistance protein YoaR